MQSSVFSPQKLSAKPKDLDSRMENRGRFALAWPSGGQRGPGSFNLHSVLGIWLQTIIRLHEGSENKRKSFQDTKPQSCAEGIWRGLLKRMLTTVKKQRIHQQCYRDFHSFSLGKKVRAGKVVGSLTPSSLSTKCPKSKSNILFHEYATLLPIAS